MKRTLCVLLLSAVVCGLCAAQSLDGRKINLEGGDQASVNAPVSVSFDGVAPDKPVAVTTKDGKSYPATIRDKALVFVVDALAPKEKVEAAVTVLKDAKPPRVAITKKEGVDELDVAIDGELFTTYHYSNDNRKPFLWPVYGEGKVTVTRNWPMDQNEKGSTDHVHQKSLWTSYGDINGVDCWGETEENSGYEHSDEVTFGSGDAYGWIHAKNTWQDKDHKPVIGEEREYRFYVSPVGARTLDVSITFTAAYGAAKFGDTKEGGILAFRIHPSIQQTKGGKIVNAEGLKGMKECWGKPSVWTDYYGDFPGAGLRGIAVFDNAANLRFPTRWHIRDYGLNGANCFGLKYFTEKDPERLNGDWTLDDKKSQTFSYRVVVHSGDETQAKIADRYADYAKPPKAEWVK